MPGEQAGEQSPVRSDDVYGRNVMRRMAQLYDLAEDTVKARRSWDRLEQLKGRR